MQNTEIVTNSQDMINKGQASQAKSSWEYTMYKALITGQWIMRKPPVFANGQLFSSWSTPENSWSGNISLIPQMREPESLWVNQQDIWIFRVDLQIIKFQKTAYLVIIPPNSTFVYWLCLWMHLEIKIKTGHLHYYSGSNITKCIYMYAIKIKQKKKH